MIYSTNAFSRVSFCVSPLDHFSFVVEFFTTTEGDDEFDVITSGQEFGRDDAHTGFFAGGEIIDLAAAGQEFADAGIDRTCTTALLVELEAKTRVIEP